MKSKIIKSAYDFLNLAGDKLMCDEAKHGLTIGIVERVVNDLHAYGENDPWFIVIEESGQILGTAICTPPNSSILSYFSGEIKEVSSTMVNAVHEIESDLPGVLGSNEIVVPFAEQWCGKYKTRVSRMIAHRLYRLTELIRPEFTDGFLRKAAHDDEDLVIEWTAAFHEEALGERLTEHQHKLYLDRISSGDIYLWDITRPVSMAVSSRPTRRGISIGGVFTPPSERNHGYATSCVAALCEELLSKYDFCLLFADLSNPVSNSIYMKMGFKEYCDTTNYSFS